MLAERERKHLHDSIFIAPKYADDMIYTPKNEEERTLNDENPSTLKTHDLIVNKSITEEYTIPTPPFLASSSNFINGSSAETQR